MYKYPISVVRVILENPEEDILFLKRTSLGEGANQWCLPGGKVDYGKTLEEACVDELKEETTLNISDLKFLFYDERMPFTNEKPHYITFYFTANYSGETRINEESSDLRWIAQSDLDNYDIAFGHDSALLKYLKNG